MTVVKEVAAVATQEAAAIQAAAGEQIKEVLVKAISLAAVVLAAQGQKLVTKAGL